MKVTEIRHVEDCFDGSLIKELLFSSEVTQKFIYALGMKGKLQYFTHFVRPFFKIRVDGIYDIKGIEGNNYIRIHLKNPEEYTLDDFIESVKEIK